MKWLWTALVLLLSALLYVQWEVAPIDVPRFSPRREMGGVAEPPTVTAPELSDPLRDPAAFDVISQRPLFVEERRPREEDDSPETGQVQAGELDGLDLNAVLIRPGESLAWVWDPAAGETLRLRVGDLLRGWRVKSIEGDTLGLENEGRVVSIELRDYSAPKAVPAGAAAGNRRKFPADRGRRPPAPPPTRVPNRRGLRPNGQNQ